MLMWDAECCKQALPGISGLEVVADAAGCGYLCKHTHRHRQQRVPQVLEAKDGEGEGLGVGARKGREGREGGAGGSWGGGARDPDATFV